MASIPEPSATYLPALRDASNDAELRGKPFAIYAWLVTNYLDTQELRPVRVNELCLAVQANRQTVTRSLRLLTQRGYLERRYSARGGYCYRAFLIRRRPLVPENDHRHLGNR